MKEKVKAAPLIKSHIKQPQGGCPAINASVNPIFNGYDHRLTKEEKERFEKKVNEFWERLKINE